MVDKTNKISTEIAVMKSELENIKETNIETKLQNTAEHVQIIKRLDSFDVKLDDAIRNKAEKTDLMALDNRFWGIVIGMLFLLAGIIAAWFK